MAPQRIAWQDVAKGIGIVLVVFGHVERGLRAAGLIAEAPWSAVDFGLYTFHMPLFMFLAGLNVPASLAKGSGRFVRAKTLTILYPYVVWSLLQGTTMVALGGMTNGHQDWHDLLRIGWQPISPFWFLYALYAFMLAASMLPLPVFTAVAAIGYVAGEWFDPNAIVHQLLHFPLFFVAGIHAARRAAREPMVGMPAALAGAGVLAATLAVAFTLALPDYNSVLMLPAAAGGIVATIWLSERLAGHAWLARVGRLSMSVYVMHVLAGAGTRIALDRVLHVPHLAWLYLLLCTLAGVLAPLVAHALAGRLGLLPWLGLGTGARGRAWIAESTGRAAAHTRP